MKHLQFKSSVIPAAVSGNPWSLLKKIGSPNKAFGDDNLKGLRAKSRFLLAALLSLALPGLSWADITNTASVAYQDAAGNPYTVASNTVGITTPPVITSPPAAAGTVNVAFNYQISATDSPTGYAVTAGSLPPGLTLNSATGLISGTPAAAGIYPVILSAANAAGSGTLNLTLTINNPTPTLSALSPASATAGGSQFTLTVTGSNFVNGSAVSWNGSNLTTTFVSVTGLTAIVPAGDIVGAGTASVTVVNPPPGGGPSSALTFTINSAAPVPIVNSPTSATGDKGAAFSYQISATNPPILSYGATGLPWNGLSLNAGTGLISGTPAAAGSVSVNLTATNSSGTSIPVALTITIRPPAAITLSKTMSAPTAKPGDTVGFTITYQNNSAGAAHNVVITDAIPAGTTLVPGTITGGGTASGGTITWTFDTIAGSGSGSVSFTVKVN